MSSEVQYEVCPAYGVVDKKTISEREDCKEDRTAGNAQGPYCIGKEDESTDYSYVNPVQLSLPASDPPPTPSFSDAKRRKSASLLYISSALVVITSSILAAFLISTATGFAKVSRLESELKMARNGLLDRQSNKSTITANYTLLDSLLPNPYSQWIKVINRNPVLKEITENCVSRYLFGNSSLTQCVDVIATTYGTSEFTPAASCEEIHMIQPANSGYYWVTSSNGSSVRVFCEMTLTCANRTGGLTRAFVLNREAKAQYCTGDVKSDDIGCVRTSSEPGCSEMSFPLSKDTPFSNLCVRAGGSFFGSTDGYHGTERSVNTTIDDNYVDGISLTCNISSQRNHLWTFSARVANCSQGVPDFVGTNHSCLRFINSYNRALCTLIEPAPPTFLRHFQEPVPDSIEVRLCQDQHRDNDHEGLYLEDLELYVW